MPWWSLSDLPLDDTAESQTECTYGSLQQSRSILPRVVPLAYFDRGSCARSLVAYGLTVIQTCHIPGIKKWLTIYRGLIKWLTLLRTVDRLPVPRQYCRTQFHRARSLPTIHITLEIVTRSLLVEWFYG
jgi:hypothetical protein